MIALSRVVKTFTQSLNIYLWSLYLEKQMTVRKIVRKKKKNEAQDALSKVTGDKELEMAAVILKELAQRKERKKKIDDKEKKLDRIPKIKTETIKDNKNTKRLKELAELNKMGILSTEEFEKLKKDLV
jgi:hypothetical protein